jgi:hypothetical protein
MAAELIKAVQTSDVALVCNLLQQRAPVDSMLLFELFKKAAQHHTEFPSCEGLRVLGELIGLCRPAFTLYQQFVPNVLLVQREIDYNKPVLQKLLCITAKTSIGELDVDLLRVWCKGLNIYVTSNDEGTSAIQKKQLCSQLRSYQNLYAAKLKGLWSAGSECTTVFAYKDTMWGCEDCGIDDGGAGVPVQVSTILLFVWSD